MSRFTDAMRGLGFGADARGDARRRDELPGTFSALRDSPYLRRALEAEADRIRQEAAAMTPRGPAADWSVTDDPEPVPGHLLTRERTPAGNTVVRCECGRWDGAWTGPRSRRRVLDDYAAHVAAELKAAGPIKVKAERADQPRELE